MKSVAIIIGLLVPASAGSAHAATEAQEVFQALGFDDESLKKAAAGQIVTTSVKGTSERELSVGLGFMVKAPPSELVEELQAGLLLKVDANAKAHGRLQGPGSLADFEGLTLSADEIASYQNAKAGEELNLSAAEIKAFQAAGRAGVEKQLKETLLGRLRAYQSKGFDGLAPYDRGDGKTSPVGQDLKNASQRSAILEKFAPSFYKVFVAYPADKEALEEQFLWTHYEAHGSPVVILTHGFSMKTDDFYVVCQRQFYVTASYNAEQAVASLLPVKEGTAVAYVNRTFTDQVTGFGSSTKRSIGSKILSGQLEDLFSKFSNVAAQ